MTNVYGTIQIVAAALHVKNGTSETAFYLGQLCQPIIQRTQINCVKVSALLLADGHCGQMSVEYDPVKLAATGIKIHVTRLFDLCRNHTHLCIYYII
jgi:hypothetical protein